MLEARGQCAFPSAGSLEKLSATVIMCVRKNGLWRFFCWHEAFVSLRKT